MRTKDVMLKTGITRKAIEYYEKQGFFTAERDENGYRNYESESCALLRKIRALRRLGLSVAEIKEIFEAERPEISFSKLLRDREIRRSIDEKRRDIIKRLAEGARLETLGPEIESIDAEQTIFERLCEKFPGHMGRLLFLNYRPFLGERLETDRQKRAFDE